MMNGVHNLAQRFFERAGYTVITAEDGEEALCIIREVLDTVESETHQ